MPTVALAALGEFHSARCTCCLQIRKNPPPFTGSSGFQFTETFCCLGWCPKLLHVSLFVLRSCVEFERSMTFFLEQQNEETNKDIHKQTQGPSKLPQITHDLCAGFGIIIITTQTRNAITLKRYVYGILFLRKGITVNQESAVGRLRVHALNNHYSHAYTCN